MYKNCSQTSLVSHTVAPTTVDTFTVTSSSLVGGDFTSGVYKIELVVKADGGTIYKEFLCKYIDCDSTGCELIGDYANATDKLIAYKGLEASNSCPQCSCDDMCLLNSIITQADEPQCQSCQNLM